MERVRVTIELNEAPWAEKFDGYVEGQPLRRVFGYTIETEVADDIWVAEHAFTIGNVDEFMASSERSADLIRRYRAERVRSVSVGDVVGIQRGESVRRYAVESAGWREV